MFRSCRRAMIQRPHMRPCDSEQTDAGMSNMVDPRTLAIILEHIRNLMKKRALMAIGLSVAMANYALADTLPKTATSTATSVNPLRRSATQLTCEEFLSYDELPGHTVYWSEGLNGKASQKIL